MDRPFAAYTGDESYVFVSYTHGDSPDVYPELVWLKDHGINIWYDEGIQAGSEWREEIGKAIKHASLFLYFISPDSAQSENCKKEVNFADKEQIPIVPIYLKDTILSEGLDLTLSDLQAILKYKVPDSEYRQKLIAHTGSYLSIDIAHSAPRQKNRALRLTSKVMFVAIVGVLALVFYNNQRSSLIDSDDSAASTSIETESQIATTTDEIAAKYSIAVLPFSNLTNEKEYDALAYGVSEEVLNNLENIQVASRTASFQFTGSEDPSVIGETLKVGYLVEGSIRQLGDSIGFSVRLIRTDDGYQVWSKSYRNAEFDPFSFQSSVGVNIAQIVVPMLTIDVARRYGWKLDPRFSSIDESHRKAMHHYLNAIEEFERIRLGEDGDLAVYVHHVNKSIESDPSFYRGYVQLLSWYMESHNRGIITLQQAMRGTETAIAKAAELAPDDTFFRFQLAQVYMRLDLDYERAVSELYSAQAEMFFYIGSRYFLAEIAFREGRVSDGLQILSNISSRSGSVEQAIFFAGVGFLRNVGGDYEGALEATAQGLELALAGPDRIENLYIRAQSLVMLERYEEAMTLINEGWSLIQYDRPERYMALFAQTGQIEKARKILNDPRYEPRLDYHLALTHLNLGNIDEAFEFIRTGIENHDRDLVRSLTAEWWDPIRDDPRFDEMIELLDSKVKHTEQYLLDHGTTPGDV